MHKIFIVALKLREISMCTITNKFRKNVVERAFIQEIKALMSNPVVPNLFSVAAHFRKKRKLFGTPRIF